MKLDSSNVLADENISPKVVKCLRDQGLHLLDAKTDREQTEHNNQRKRKGRYHVLAIFGK